MIRGGKVVRGMFLVVVVTVVLVFCKRFIENIFFCEYSSRVFYRNRSS